MIKLQTLKGFRDFLPPFSLEREYLINKVKSVLQKFGFDPIETPALEYAETLLGKYGQEADKLLYLFKDKGGRQVGLRYDQTVPTARVVAAYQNLPMPFKRYQIQPVWRAENPQKGRFREFLQIDADIFGSNHPVSDAEILALLYEIFRQIGFNNIQLLYNDRKLFSDLPLKAIIIIDKIAKIGRAKVLAELKKSNIDIKLLAKIENNKPSANLAKIINIAQDLGIPKNVLVFSPTLARGLDYYTSVIVEVVAADYNALSLAGGGRYDNLIGKFIGKDTPAVGFALGFDRIHEAAKALNLIPQMQTAVIVLVTIFDANHLTYSAQMTKLLRNAGIASELYPDANDRLDKQIRYADKRSIRYCAILGPEEIKSKKITLKNLSLHSQVTILQDEAAQFISKQTQ